MELKKFSTPPAIYRPAPFWSWNDKLDEQELRRQIREMANKGWGGYFMHSRVGLVTGYLSDEWMQLVKACAEEAKATGTYAWLYDEDKWPSGFAGGIVPQNPEYRSRALVALKKEQITEDDTVLAEYTEDDTTYFICKRVSPLGNKWFNGASYVDLMNPEAVKYFIKCTHEKYKEHCGEFFGKEIPGIFTDEPCYLMEGHYNVPALPWSEYLPSFFQNLKGYDIQKHLVELFFDIGDYKRIRFDFFDSATRLFIESFTKQYYEWCEENNLIMTGHFMAEDTLPYQLQWIGAAMPHYEFMHWPGIDKLGRHIEQVVTVKQVTSAADQLGKERSFCEVFGCIGQQCSFYHRKWIADWQAALGISFVNHHLSLYSMRGERKRDYPANLYYQQPWWNDEKEFGDYIGRLSYVVSQGKRNVDILILHTISSVWSEYSPLHKKNNLMVEKGVYDEPFTRLSKALLAYKLDFHYGDEIIMEKHARVEGGKLIIGQHAYSSVIVPPSLTLRSNTVKLLKQFASEAGADRIIFLKPRPTRIDGKAAELDWPGGIVSKDSINEVIDYLDKLYQDRIRVIDKVTGRNAEAILCHERTAGDDRWMLLVNTEENREINANISIPETRKPYILDLSSGELYDCECTIDGTRINLDIKFYPAGSIVLYFTESKLDAKPLPGYLDSGVQFISNPDTISMANGWEVSLLESNVLPLNNVTLYMDGKLVLENGPIAKAWHEHFYSAPEGSLFKAEYTFDVLNVPDGEMFAVIEVAENLDRITLNGKTVTPLKTKGELGALNLDKSWKDINFTKVPITGLIQQGKNTLILEGKKSNNITGPGTHIGVKNFKEHMPTEVETVYILGNFSVVNENNTRFWIDGNMEKPDHKDLTTSGYPFYAGRAQFTAQFIYSGDNTKPLYLQLNGVEAACVEIYVNGKYAGTKRWAPYVCNISELVHKGKNDIKLIASTTLFNLMGPGWINNIEDLLFVGPGTFVNLANFTEQYTFMPFGIKGASIMTEK